MWHLCDGKRGTPDLRDRFLVGAGGTYAPAGTGGALSHIHTATTDGHWHTMAGGTDLKVTPGALDLQTSTDTDTFTSATANTNLSPYYALSYVMYLKVKR